MSDCVFCQIADGRETGHVVYADDDVLAFLDIAPITPGHTLVIPRRHASGLADLDPALGARLFTTGQRIAAAMRSPAFGADGVNLALNDGRAAFQTVFHTHLHVLPRADGDRLRLARGFLTRRPGDLAAVAGRLRAAIGATAPGDDATAPSHDATDRREHPDA
ncbi:HIT family protein [Gordonia sp. VNK21]|uniref:HIT family protein n=1 Tax=Gordonia sp. VNK21 TaxID=3382483 RepID=UPI0038D4B4CC